MANKKQMLGNKNAWKGHDSHLHLRCKSSDKAVWEHATQQENLKLSAWVVKTLNEATQNED